VKKAVVTGAIAGLCGGIGMKALVCLFDPDSFGLSARTDARFARAIWARIGCGELDEKSAERIGALVHYAFATATGVGYALTAARLPVIRAGRGTLFGAGLWFLGDECAISVSGLEEPGRARLRSHVSALAAHLIYGVVLHSIASTVAVSPEPTGVDAQESV
jgi:hypothetical protein